MLTPPSKLTSVELFAGIGGFRLAAEAFGVRTIWANDINKKACRVYRDRFGSSELVEADVNTVLHTIPPHDILTAGFPCQPFSSAGKKEGIRDPRGTLFQAIVEVLQTHQPTYFVLENVKRLLTMEQGSHFATILEELARLSYFIEWRLLNAMDFGLPQNRQRIVIVGIHHRQVERYINEGCTPPIRLASEADLADVPSSVITSLKNMRSWRPIAFHGRTMPSWGLACDGKFIGYSLCDFSERYPSVLLREVLEPEVDDSFDFTESTLKRMETSTPIGRLVQGVEILFNQGGGARMGYTVFGVNGLAPTLTATTSRHYERYKVADRYRRLTGVEYARIQGFPEDHCRAASLYDRYALIGNSVPPPMAQFVFKRLFTDGTTITHGHKHEPDLFDHA